MKNKITILIIIFLLIIPFRLPVSILLIHFFEWIIGITTTDKIPQGILSTNVIITKLVYNIVLSSFFLYRVEIISRDVIGRKAMSKDSYRGTEKDEPIFWWVVPIGILLLVFTIVDAISVYDIFQTVQPVIKP